MSIREQLNGLGPMADALQIALANQRRDLRADVATMQAEVRGALLDLERLTTRAREAIAAIKDGAPGRNGVDGAPGGRGERGERGEPGAAGVFTPPERHEAGKVYFRGQLVYFEGTTYCAICPTAATPPHEQWQPVAHRGASGRALGLYQLEGRYRALDVVSFNGSEWRAVRDDPGPLPGDGWVLGAKQGKRGDKGERGEKGDPGVGIEGMAIKGYALEIRLTNGTELVADLTSMFEMFADELEGAR